MKKSVIKKLAPILLTLIGFGVSFATLGYYGRGYEFGFPITFNRVWPCQIPPCPEEFLPVRYLLNSLIWIGFFLFIYFLVRKVKNLWKKYI